ncbi:MAG: hypothetical protein H0T73_15550, partial [Ardenticatenales bacterium]|nr:hypothetical protein [Ardenticatenales bacterium]
ILALQRTIGNQAVQRLLTAHPLHSPVPQRQPGPDNGLQGTVQRQIIKAETTNGRVFYLNLDEAEAAVMEKMGYAIISEAQRRKIGELFNSEDPFSVSDVSDMVSSIKPKILKSEAPKSNMITSNVITSKSKVANPYKQPPKRTYKETVQELQADVMEKMEVDDLTEEQEIKFLEMVTSERLLSISEIARRLRELESQQTPSQWVAQAREEISTGKDIKKSKKRAKREIEIAEHKSSTKKEFPGSTSLTTTTKATPVVNYIDNTTGNHDPNILGTLSSAANTIKSATDVGQGIKIVMNTTGEERKEAAKELVKDSRDLTINALGTAGQVTTTISQIGASDASKIVPYFTAATDLINVGNDSVKLGQDITNFIKTDGKESGTQIIKHATSLGKDSTSAAGNLLKSLNQTGVIQTTSSVVPILGAVTGGITTLQDAKDFGKKTNLAIKHTKLKKVAKEKPFHEALAVALQTFVDNDEVGMVKDGVKVVGDMAGVVGSILSATGIGAVAGLPLSTAGVVLNLAAESADKIRDYWKAHNANNAEKEYEALKAIGNDIQLAAQIVLGYARAERGRLALDEKPNKRDHPALSFLKSFGISVELFDESSDEVLRPKLLGKAGKADKESATLMQDLRKGKKKLKKFNSFDINVSDKEERKLRKLMILARLKNLINGKEKRDENWAWDKLQSGMTGPGMGEEQIDIDIQAALNKLDNPKPITDSEKLVAEKLAQLREDYNQLLGKEVRFDTSSAKATKK